MPAPPKEKVDHGEAKSTANMLPTVRIKPILSKGNYYQPPHLNGISFWTKARKYKCWFDLLVTHMTVPFVFQCDEQQG